MNEWREADLGLAGVKIITPGPFEDERGLFTKVYHQEIFFNLGFECPPKEVFYTVSKKNVIRGMHIQLPPFQHAKLVHCCSGGILDVILDVRKTSPTFGRVISRVLSAANRDILLIPIGCAHGFLALADNSTVLYQTSTVHHPDYDSGILWNSIPFDWGIKDPIVSQRDRCHACLEEFSSPFK